MTTGPLWRWAAEYLGSGESAWEDWNRLGERDPGPSCFLFFFFSPPERPVDWVPCEFGVDVVRLPACLASGRRHFIHFEMPFKFLPSATRKEQDWVQARKGCACSGGCDEGESLGTPASERYMRVGGRSSAHEPAYLVVSLVVASDFFACCCWQEEEGGGGGGGGENCQGRRRMLGSSSSLSSRTPAPPVPIGLPLLLPSAAESGEESLPE